MFPHQLPSLIHLPLEILTEIAFELSALQPLGPPWVLLPLLLTSVRIYDLLSPVDNSGLWARIFRHKFDSAAIKQRAVTPAPEHYADQLARYCQAMQVLRVANRYAGYHQSIWEPVPDVGLEEALETALLMMYEDDGKNSRQLLEWANLGPLLKRVVQSRTYEGSRMNHGWALENRLNACSLWLMWMLTSQESLKNQPEEERRQLIKILLPFVLFPYRYPVAEAPPNYFHIPFIWPPDMTIQTTSTIQTVHGKYPVFPPSLRTHNEIHYSTSPIITVPLAAPAAKLLFFALNEVTPVHIPDFLAQTREEWIASGNSGIAPTKDVLNEFNWGWYARLPLGQGRDERGGGSLTEDRNALENTWRWKWGLGDNASPDALFGDLFREPMEGGGPVTARWDGKAPHTGSRRQGSDANLPLKSTMWNADWWRSRLCGDPMRLPTRVPYGRVYEPGCMDGFWQGRMVTPGESELQALLENPTKPEEFTEERLRVMFDFIFVEFREAHGIVGVDHGDELGPFVDNEEDEETEETDDNMNNAWFAGESGTTTFRLREGQGLRGEDNVEIAVTDEWGRVRQAVFPCWQRGAGEGSNGIGLGNDAVRLEASASAVYEEEKGCWTGYQHDQLDCEECLARRRVSKQLEKERAEEEAKKTRGALGASGPPSSGEEGEGDGEDEDGDECTSSSTASAVSYDTLLDEWDPSYGFDTDEQGNVYPPLPPAHDRTKLAKGTCTGIRDIYLVGETPQRHGDAFNHFTYYGRVRMWDGLIAILRKPKFERDSHLGNVLFYGYLVGGENFVGNWRIARVDPALPAWEGAFVMSRRRD